MSEFDDWYRAGNVRDSDKNTDYLMVTAFVEGAFNAGMEIGERKGMELAAKMAEKHIHQDWGPLLLECGNEIAVSIRKEIT